MMTLDNARYAKTTVFCSGAPAGAVSRSIRALLILPEDIVEVNK